MLESFKLIAYHHKRQWIAEEKNPGECLRNVRYCPTNQNDASQDSSTKQEHVEKVSCSSPEWVLLEKFAVARKKKHVEQEIQIWKQE